MSGGTCELCGKALPSRTGRGQPPRFHKPCGQMVRKMREALGVKLDGYAGQKGRAHNFARPSGPVGTDKADPVPLTRETMANLLSMVGEAIGAGIDDVEAELGGQLPNMRSAARSAAFQAGNGKYLRPRKK